MSHFIGSFTELINFDYIDRPEPWDSIHYNFDIAHLDQYT